MTILNGQYEGTPQQQLSDTNQLIYVHEQNGIDCDELKQIAINLKNIM